MLSFAYFLVFIIGVVFCVRSSKGFVCNGHYFKAGSTLLLVILAMAGLVQAILGA